ncbi:CBS domain-containing protein [Nonomuraea sp. NPDC052129]|uniref:CBS domain-containing protein n=1 Tax=Nonomuraea sp. NPDC052129 TaxID=3154651 RepID=UPI00342740F2
MPLKSQPGKIAIGQVVSSYEYQPGNLKDFPNVRAVEWFPDRRAREIVKPDLRASMGSLLTVSRLRRHEAPRRIAQLATEGIDPGVDGEPEITDVAKLLENAVERAESDPRKLPIRHLLAHWGVWRRTSAVIEMIRDDLAEVGLTTRPLFTEGSVDTEIALVPIASEPSPADATAKEGEQAGDQAKPTSGKLRLGNLPSKLVSVTPHTSLNRARTLMLQKGFSQLAVVAEDGTLHGAVTWESIGKAHISSNNPTLRDALTPPSVVDHDALLLDQIEEIRRRGFILVRNIDRKNVTGIVTAADLTGQFGQHAKPFLLIEDAESRLRRAAEVFSVEDLRAAVPRHQQARVHAPKDLTFGNYKYLLEDQGRWQTLGWKIDHSTLLNLLEEVKQIRNEIMHFALDSLSDRQHEAIEELLILLDAAAPEK